MHLRRDEVLELSSERVQQDEDEHAQQRGADHREDGLPLRERRLAAEVALDALDRVEVGLATAAGQHPARDRRDVLQRAGRVLAIALRVAARSAAMSVQEGAGPRVWVLPGIHETGIGALRSLIESRGCALDV
jgi:hypothetical protein